jgi:hypothetical protein
MKILNRGRFLAISSQSLVSMVGGMIGKNALSLEGKDHINPLIATREIKPL